MTTISSKLLLASKNQETGDVLCTFVWTYPRMILAEVNTHRMLSRNTSSSRAIPSKKQRAKVWDDPFVPTSIGVAQKGMQAGDELTGWRRTLAENIWTGARYPQLAAAWSLDKLGVHKQISNRLIETWTWTQQVVSATDLNNLFLLRDHAMAEPHFAELAKQAHEQKRKVDERIHDYLDPTGPSRDPLWVFGPDNGIVQRLLPGDWHLPFASLEDVRTYGLENTKMMSAARCARTSYLLPENGERSSLGRDLELFQRLAVRREGDDDPKHLSPLEHVAMACGYSEYYGNFKGFKQYRKDIDGESGD